MSALETAPTPPDETELRRRIEVDAAWVITAPALVQPSFWQGAGVEAAGCQGWRLPSASELFAQAELNAWWRHKNRLGHHFEFVHSALLRAQPGVVVHALNLSLQGAKQTLGEIDCLYSNAQGEVIHREVAVKYFLGFAESDQLANWVGTSKTDRLDLKLKRLAEHQAKLADLALQQQAWPSALPFPVRREVLMLGAFFKHPTHSAWPAVMAKSAEGGFWCTTEQFIRLVPEDSSWACLHKPWWLDPKHRWSAPRMTAVQVAADVQAHRHPLLIADVRLPAGLPLQGRGFVVPDGWEANPP